MSPRGRLVLGVSLAAALLAAHQWLFAGYTVDDAFINFRYARHVARGEGFAYNAGDPPVMGFVDTLWILLLAACDRLGLELPVASKAIGAAFALGALVLSALLARRLAGETGLPLAPLLCAASGPFALWTVSGMETGLFAFLVTASFVTLFRAGDSPRRFALAGFLFALATATRPEALGLGLVGFAAYAVVARPPARGGVAFLAALGAPLVVYAAWISATFPDPLPNPFYAKGSPGDPRLWKPGVAYALSFFTDYGGATLLVLVPLAALLRPGPGRAEGTAIAAAFAAETVYAASVGGDWMEGHRFFAPLLPIGFVLVERGLRTAVEGLRAVGVRPSRAALGAACAVLLGMTAFPSRRLPHRPDTGHAHESVLEWFRANAPPGARVALWDVGAIPWHTGLRVIDFAGLTDRVLTREVGMRPFSAIPYETRVGEEVVRRVLARSPEFIVLKMNGEAPVPTELADLFHANADFRTRYHRVAGLPPSRYGIFRREESRAGG